METRGNMQHRPRRPHSCALTTPQLSLKDKTQHRLCENVSDFDVSAKCKSEEWIKRLTHTKEQYWKEDIPHTQLDAVTLKPYSLYSP